MFNKSQSGFSLIQIGILLLIASLVLVNFLPGTKLDVTNNSITTNKMNVVMNALRQYQMTNNGKLPCPADASLATTDANYGIASANTGASHCYTGTAPNANYYTDNNTAIGMVPVTSLGLSSDDALDAYGRYITYAVDTNATTCWSTPTLSGQILIADNSSVVTSVAALVSHGRDGHGAWLPSLSGTGQRLDQGSQDNDQLLNAHLTIAFGTGTSSSQNISAGGQTVTFVKKSQSDVFDDLVVYNSNQWNINTIPANAGGYVNSVAVSSSRTPATPNNYRPGDVITFTFTYNTPVKVTTAPTLALSAISGSNLTGTITPPGASGSTTTLIYTYTVGSSDWAPNGINLSLSGGSVSVGASGPSACATYSTSMSGLTIGIQLMQTAGNFATSVTTNTVAFAANVGANNHIIVFSYKSNGGTVSSITDTKGSTFTSIYNSGNFAVYWAGPISSAGSDSVTVNWSGTAASVGLSIREYSGLNLSAPVDQKATATTAPASCSATTPATTSAYELIYGFLAQDGGPSAIAKDAAYSNLQQITATPYGAFLQDNIVSTTGTYSPTFTGQANSGNHYCGVVTFKR